MKKTPFTPYILASAIAVASGAQAAEVRINGFASVVGGTTLSQGTATNQITGATSKATYAADGVTEGVYDDEISFKPDSNFGLQISADLGSGLSVTGQITGNGGEDFDANVSWAYITYEINDNWSIMGGRQRLPLFFYSDFIDVGYAYHWIRPPQDLAAARSDTLEGVKLAWKTSTDNWDWSLDGYYGTSTEAIDGLGDLETRDTHGLVAKTSNDWLQLRASYSHSDIIITSNVPGLVFSSGGVLQATEDNRLGFGFWGLAAHMTFDNIFVVTEYTVGEPEESFGSDNGINGNNKDTAWYISSGIRLGDLTPHITYGERVRNHEQTGSFIDPTFYLDDVESHAEYWTLGVRWDFHPSAAAKIEYTTRSDDSDDAYKNSIGLVGYGDSLEVDVFAVGVDVIF